MGLGVRGMPSPFSKLYEIPPVSPQWVVQDPFALAVNPEEDKRRQEVLDKYRLNPSVYQRLKDQFRIVDQSSEQRAKEIIKLLGQKATIEKVRERLFGTEVRPMTVDRIAQILYFLKKEVEQVTPSKSFYTNSIEALFEGDQGDKAKSLIGNKLFQTLNYAESFQKGLTAEEFDQLFESEQLFQGWLDHTLREKQISPLASIEKLAYFLNAESKWECELVLKMPGALEKMSLKQELDLVKQAQTLSANSVGEAKVEYLFDLTRYVKNFLESVPLPAYFSMTGDTKDGEFFKVYIKSSDFGSNGTSFVSSSQSDSDKAEIFKNKMKDILDCYLTLPEDPRIRKAYLNDQGRKLSGEWQRLTEAARVLVGAVELGVVSLTFNSSTKIEEGDFASVILLTRPVMKEEKEVLNAKSFIEMLDRYKRFVSLLPSDRSIQASLGTVEESYFKQIIPKIQQQWESLAFEEKDKVINAIREAYRGSQDNQLKQDFSRENIKIGNKVIAPFKVDNYEEQVTDELLGFFAPQEGDNMEMCYEHLSQRSLECQVAPGLFQNKDFKPFLKVEDVLTADITTDYFLFKDGEALYIKYDTQAFQLCKADETGEKSNIAKGSFQALFKITKTERGYYLELKEASLRLPQVLLKEERVGELANYFSSKELPLNSGWVPLANLLSQISIKNQVGEEQQRAQDVQAASSSMQQQVGDEPRSPSP